MRLTSAALALTALLAAPNAGAQAPGISPTGERIDLLRFQINDLGEWERLQRSSQSRPLTLDELEKLSGASIGEKSLVEMMRTRGVLAVADAETLIRLKKGGATDDMVAAVSAFALPPNEEIDLRFLVDVVTPYQVNKAPYLYVELHHVERNEQASLLFSDLRALLSQRWRVDEVRDDSDPILKNKLRSLSFWGRAPARHPGRLEVRVLVSQRPGLRDLRAESLRDDERKRLITFPVDYPGVSRRHACTLQLKLERDPLLADLFIVPRSDLRCEWD
jgi:hypothetical protein